MGAGYRIQCDKCGHVVQTSRPWEFYRDAKGRAKDYGHPQPSSDEASIAGIAGLRAMLYCPDCDKTSEVIIVEFKTSSKDALAVWSGRCEPMDEYCREDAVKCPQCRGANMLMVPDEGETIPCPRCKDRKMSGAMDFIT